MSSVDEITEAIRRLPAAERWNLLHRFSEELWIEWDSQIRADSEGGTLASVVAEAKSEIQSGLTRPLHEILRDE